MIIFYLLVLIKKYIPGSIVYFALFSMQIESDDILWFHLGSTDTVVYCTSGNNDPSSSALRIIMGELHFVCCTCMQGEVTFVYCQILYNSLDVKRLLKLL